MDLKTKAALDLATYLLNWQLSFAYTWSPCNNGW